MSQLSFPKDQIRIVLSESVHESAIEVFERYGFKVELRRDSISADELVRDFTDVHVLGIRSKTQIPAEYFEKSKRLLAVGCFCIGTNQVEVGSAKLSGVPVFNAPYSNTRSVAELILAEIVMLSRKAADRSMKLHQGKWEKSAEGCYEIRTKTLGIVGFGHIGSQVGILAEAFGMNVLYYDSLPKMPIGNSKPTESLDDLLSQSDFVTLHVPETDLTKNMIGGQQLSRMKKGGYLLNASRGSVVDIPALCDSLRSGHLAGAAIDVYPDEPKGNSAEFSSELLGLPNVILTPHIGGSTEEAQKNIGVEVASRLIKFIDQGSSVDSVNFPQLDTPMSSSAHRILHVHKNVPGVIAQVSTLISDVGANILGQNLATDPDIGYLIVDVDKELSETVRQKLSELSISIKTRILF